MPAVPSRTVLPPSILPGWEVLSPHNSASSQETLNPQHIPSSQNPPPAPCCDGDKDVPGHPRGQGMGMHPTSPG